jgi:hypothetical protein
MAQQTAVDWLVNNLPQRFKNIMLITGDKIIEQAKAMEKEQISEAYRQSVEEDVWNNPLRTGEEYYNETYNKL